MAGRRNYQTCTYQRIRENLWQIGWVEGQYLSQAHS